jgi:nitric oxide reductase NorD protein
MPQATTTVARHPKGGAELELGRYSYPEWDRKQERLRPDWCTVIEKLPAWQGLSPMREQAAANNERLTPLALPRARHLDRTHRLRRQWEGDDVDLNAAIEVLVDRRLRLRPDPRLFMRPGKAPRATSVLVLLDLSESVNDAGQGGQARSLLDIEKQAALLLAASSNSNARQGADRLAIHGFSSNTRDEVYYYRLLEFGRPLEAPSRAMIGAVRGRYSTRMGAALRHATAHLRAEPAGQRAILLVTDGAPSDIDVHDPQYLIEDAPHGRGRGARGRRAHRLHRGRWRGRCVRAPRLRLAQLLHRRRCTQPAGSPGAHERTTGRRKLRRMMAHTSRRHPSG